MDSPATNEEPFWNVSLCQIPHLALGSKILQPKKVSYIFIHICIFQPSSVGYYIDDPEHLFVYF